MGVFLGKSRIALIGARHRQIQQRVASLLSLLFLSEWGRTKMRRRGRGPPEPWKALSEGGARNGIPASIATTF